MDVTMKIPEPIIEPATRLVASINPRDLLKFWPILPEIKLI